MNLFESKIFVSSLGFLLILSFFECFALTYLWMDRSITLSYVKSSFMTNEILNKNFLILINSEWIGIDKKEIVLKLNEIKNQHSHANFTIKEDNDGFIWFEDIKFQFELGRLKDVGSNG